MDENRLVPVLALCFGLSTTSSIALTPRSQHNGEGGSTQTQTAPTVEEPYWHQIPEQGFLSFALAREEETDGEMLQGPRLGWGLWDEEDEIGGVSLYLSSVGGEHQRISRVGFEGLGFLTWPIGPVRIFPTYGLGIEYRSHDPDSGYGGLGAVGLETAIWLGKHLQLGARLEREFEFRSDDRTAFTFSLKWMDTRLMLKHSP